MEGQHKSVVESAFCSTGACLPLRPSKRLRDVLELHLVEVRARRHKVRDEPLQILLLNGSRTGGFRADGVDIEPGEGLVVG